MYDFTLQQLFTNFIAFLALAVAIYSLYLQRKDKKPLLKITAQFCIKQLPLKQDSGGGMIDVDAEVVSLIIRNPTEREIKLDKLEFLENKSIREIKVYKETKEFHPHSNGEIIILLEHFPYRECYFIIYDALGNAFKSNKLMRIV